MLRFFSLIAQKNHILFSFSGQRDWGRGMERLNENLLTGNGQILPAFCFRLVLWVWMFPPGASLPKLLYLPLRKSPDVVPPLSSPAASLAFGRLPWTLSCCTSSIRRVKHTFDHWLNSCSFTKKTYYFTVTLCKTRTVSVCTSGGRQSLLTLKTKFNLYIMCNFPCSFYTHFHFKLRS